MSTGNIKTTNVSRPYTWKERLYLLTIPKGFLVTLRYFIRGFFLRKSNTISYPEERRNYSERFRGMHFISLDENKLENCTACYLCQTVCPAKCITITAEERDPKENPVGVAKEKRPKAFDIDALRCCFCGMCEEACPKDAIKMSRNYELAVHTREMAMYDLKHLSREVKNRG
ncbi:MAG: NADH-quinone oxidoreductase subunit I [Oligoflexia bacterium]|nr:NADH-quinone oxidoreductase subunit I [Oligoflexia bacterium]MBF0364100.1 NADH-quinone oxidoreductase subunit I [Oligoflexia bacterium]